MTRHEYAAAARAKGLADSTIRAAASADAAAFDRHLAPVRDRRVDPVVRPFDRQRDHRVGRQQLARPTSACRPDLGDVWVTR